MIQTESPINIVRHFIVQLVFNDIGNPLPISVLVFVSLWQTSPWKKNFIKFTYICQISSIQANWIKL